MTLGSKAFVQDVTITYRREGFASPAGHSVRTNMESAVCQWLMEHGVAHRHASEVLTVVQKPRSEASLFVPDIVLHDRNDDGKMVLIEIVDSYVTKEGGTRLLSNFRAQAKSGYYMIVIAKKHYMPKILRSAYDVLVDFSKLHLLERRVPIPGR